MDYCFDQILELVTQLNEKKDAKSFIDLHDICLMIANTLVGNCVIMKKIESFVNRMFKMTDGYLVEYNKLNTNAPIGRNYINLTFEALKKKKDATASQAQALAATPK